MRIAVIGSGISGSLAARLLHSHHDVTLFESADYAGGHANTVSVEVGERSVAVDTGFMVFNQRTYPNFCRLLNLLDVDFQPSDMSFSVRCDRTGLEYQGSSLNGIFAQRSNLFRIGFYQLLLDILRFNRLGTEAVVSGQLEPQLSVGEFLSRSRIHGRVVSDYLIPMTAAIWSGKPDTVMDFSAHFLLGFCHNHGLMRLWDRPKWQTIPGGSREYVRKLVGPLRERLRLGTSVEAVRRTSSGVEVHSTDGTEFFDQVVMATHADQSLELLVDASECERKILESFPYQANAAVLHTDIGQLPSLPRAWASWNYRIPAGSLATASVTYDLNRLQRLGLGHPLLLTLNPVEMPAAEHIRQKFYYHHPRFSWKSVEAQRHYGLISGLKHHTHFCGAYWGYGFHEDGVNSALKVANNFGIGLEQCTVASMKEPLRTAVSCL